MLKNYIPKHIYKSNVFEQVLDSEQTEIDLLNVNLVDLLNNTQIETATWQLKYLERLYGITIDETDTLENRRARIIAKKRSVGVDFNSENVKNICRSFSGGEVEIIPHLDEDYFVIKFVSTKGIPPKVEDLYNLIEEIKPAHLGVEYGFKYNTVYDLRQITVAQAKTHTVKDVIEENL